MTNRQILSLETCIITYNQTQNKETLKLYLSSCKFTHEPPDEEPGAAPVREDTFAVGASSYHSTDSTDTVSNEHVK